MFCGAAGALMVSCQPRSAVTDRRYKMQEMALLTELEILGAGLLQRMRAYGAEENFQLNEFLTINFKTKSAFTWSNSIS